MGAITPPDQLFISARWVLPISNPPLSDGVVAIERGRIKAVLPRDEFRRLYPEVTLDDYGQAVIVPGLINLHTHLDYTALRLFDPDAGLLEWIPGLASRAAAWNEEEWQRSALSGAEEVVLSGTTCLADSSYSGAAAWAIARVGLRAVVALELFGIDEGQVDKCWESWVERYESFAQTKDEPLSEALRSGRIALTVSPHAPYTVCPQLWRRALHWAEQRNLPVLTHLSESEAEVRWIAGVEPEVDEFLKVMVPGGLPDVGALPWKGRGRTPIELLADQKLLCARTVAAHAVHARENDLALLSRSGTGVAHCPRSNSRLRNGVARIESMIKAGVKVGFGTDSAASSDDLDVLAEARFAWNLARATDPSFSRPAEEAVRMLTLQAAQILGLDKSVGSLEPGKRADIAVFTMAGRAPTACDRPYDLLLYGETRLYDLFVEGEKIVEVGVIKRTS